MKKNKSIILLLTFAAFSVAARDPFEDGRKLFSRYDKKGRFEKRSILTGAFDDETGKDRMTMTSMFVLGSTTLPMSGYFQHSDDSEGPDAGIGAEIEFGSIFRLYKTDAMAICLRATWLSLGYGSVGDDFFDDPLPLYTASPLRVGPQFTLPFNDRMAADIFYQIGAQYVMLVIEDENSSFLGATHEVGGSFRYMQHNIGVGFRFGSLKNIDNSYTAGETFEGTWSVPQLRIFYGYKF